MTLKFDGWPRKIIGHLSYTTSRFVHHFKSIGEMWWMTLENNRAPLLNFIQQICASFKSHGRIQTGVTVRKRSIRSKSVIFFVPCDLGIWWMTLKIIGYLFYTTSSFVHHFKAMGEFQLESQSGHAQFGSKSAIFLSRVTWNLTDDLDLEIWQMTLQNYRAPLLCYTKLCTLFRSHWHIQTGVTVRKRPIWVKVDDFFSRMTLKFYG